MTHLRPSYCSPIPPSPASTAPGHRSAAQQVCQLDSGLTFNQRFQSSSSCGYRNTPRCSRYAHLEQPPASSFVFLMPDAINVSITAFIWLFDVWAIRCCGYAHQALVSLHLLLLTPAFFQPILTKVTVIDTCVLPTCTH